MPKMGESITLKAPVFRLGTRPNPATAVDLDETLLEIGYGQSRYGGAFSGGRDCAQGDPG